MVASNEQAIRKLTQRAQAYLTEHDHQKLTDVLAAAEKTQQRCTQLINLIGRTEKKLLAVAENAAKKAHGVDHA